MPKQNEQFIEKEEYEEDQKAVSLGNAVELTLGNGSNSFENFGCKWN